MLMPCINTELKHADDLVIEEAVSISAQTKGCFQNSCKQSMTFGTQCQEMHADSCRVLCRGDIQVFKQSMQAHPEMGAGGAQLAVRLRLSFQLFLGLQCGLNPPIHPCQPC